MQLGILNNGRIYDAVQKGAKLGIEWDQNLQSVTISWCRAGPRTRMRRDGADRRDDAAREPGEGREHHAAGADQPGSVQVRSSAVAPWLSTEPPNASKGFPINEEYWRDNYKDLAETLGSLEADSRRRACGPGTGAGTWPRQLTRMSYQDRHARSWLVAPAPCSSLGVLFVYPVSRLLLLSVTEPVPGFKISKADRGPVYLKALWNTIVISGTVTLLCVFLGYPIAYTMAQCRAAAAAPADLRRAHPVLVKPPCAHLRLDGPAAAKGPDQHRPC